MGHKRFTCKSIALYYYGMDHLTLNLQHFTQQEASKNRKVLFFPGDTLLNSSEISRPSAYLKMEAMLRETAEAYGSSSREVLFPIITENTQGLYADQLLKEGQGITWFIDAKEMIKCSSKTYYLNWQREVAQMACDRQCSVIHLYDFEDYLGAQQYIDQDIIGNSLVTNKYVVYQLKVKRNGSILKKGV